jgi:anti-anti-sigma factor
VQAGQPEFSISKQTLADCEVISVRGELDMLNAPELSRTIEALDGFPLVVDLSELTFIDSHGIHALMSAQDGREVMLICPRGNVSRVLEIVQIGRKMTVYEQLDHLLAALNGHPTADSNQPRETV